MTAVKKFFPSRLFFLICVICCLISRGAFFLKASQQVESLDIEDYIINAYTIEDGLPQNSILCLIQAKNGYLWFGTRSGLVRFDGVTPRVFNRWNTPALKNDTILSLHEDEEGILYVGSDGGGLAVKKGSTWVSYTTGEGLSNNHVRAIFKEGAAHPPDEGPGKSFSGQVDPIARPVGKLSQSNSAEGAASSARNGGLWIGTDYGLNLFKDGTFKIYTTAHGLSGSSVYAVLQDSRGSLWVGCDGDELNLKKGEKFQAFKLPGEAVGMEITALYEDAAGVLWIGGENGLYHRKNGRISKFTAQNGQFSEAVKTITGHSSGALWVGSGGSGLLRLQDNRFSSLGTDSGFLDDYIYALLEDHEGSLWVGTYTGGLLQLQKARALSLWRENGLPGDVVYTLCEDARGDLYVGTRSSGLCLCKDNRVVNIFSTKNGLSGNRIRALYPDAAGGLWIGTAGSGVNYLKDGNILVYSTSSGLSSDNVKAFLQDSSGTLWIGTDNGLNRLQQGKIVTFGSAAGLPETHKHINVLLEEGGGALLLGTKGGLLRFRDGIFLPFSAGAAAVSDEVLTLYKDRGQNLWVGTAGAGLLCFRGAEKTTYTTDCGLYNNYIFSILDDGSGNLWMSSYRGVFRVPIDELEQFADHKIKTVTSIFFDERDGMKSSECVGGGQPAAYRTAAGKLGFSTVKGVSIFDPAAVKTNDKAPQVVIEAVIVDNQPADLEAGAAEFSHEKKMYEFYFTALSFRAPARIKFRYKLEGYDRDWLETRPQHKRAALYVNLPPGRYSFRVTAANNDGLWNTTGAGFAFRIKAGFFKRPLFYFLLAAVLLAAAVGFFFFLRKGRERGSQKAEPVEKYKTSALDARRAEEILPKLVALMEKEKVYLDPDLTLKKLAERLMIHYNHLSQIINEKLQQSFNDFINRYRIEEAKKILADPEAGGKTVLEIAYDTGFYSKSVFNTAFKKFTGKTPSQFRGGVKK